MKKFYFLIIAVMLITSVFRANAQGNGNGNSGGFNQLIQSSPADATKLFQNYAEPLFKGFGTGLNGGWNNTAKTKKFLHFELRISASVALVPSSDQSFDVTKIGLSNHLTPDAQSPTNIAPTFSGSKSAATPKIDVWNDSHTQILTTFNMPNGIIQSYVPAPNVQLTVGLINNTDLTIRTIPTISLGSNAGSVGMLGFGIKHDFIQDFAKDIPKPFDLAIAVNYNKITYSKSLNVQPNGAQPAPGASAADFSDQSISGTFSGVNVQAIISKKLLFFTPFLSIAYQSGSTTFKVLGNYPITSTAYGAAYYTTVSNPVSISETSINGFRTDLGFQLNLAVFRLFVSYSMAQYNSVNGGIGFGF